MMQAGVVDSARMLLVFAAVPGLSAGGSPLHLAAATGNIDQVASRELRARTQSRARTHARTHTRAYAQVRDMTSGTTAITIVDSSNTDGTTPLIAAATAGAACNIQRASCSTAN